MAEQPVTPASLLFSKKIAPSIETLFLRPPVGMEDAKKKGLVTRLLAVPAPRLQKL